MFKFLKTRARLVVIIIILVFEDGTFCTLVVDWYDISSSSLLNILHFCIDIYILDCTHYTLYEISLKYYYGSR